MMAAVYAALCLALSVQNPVEPATQAALKNFDALVKQPSTLKSMVEKVKQGKRGREMGNSSSNNDETYDTSDPPSPPGGGDDDDDDDGSSNSSSNDSSNSSNDSNDESAMSEAASVYTEDEYIPNTGSVSAPSPPYSAPPPASHSS
jgi:hypothetical protein